MKFKNPSPDNDEIPFALSFEANFMTIHAYLNEEVLGLQSSLLGYQGWNFF